MTTACKIYSTNIFILSSSPYSSTSFAVKSMLYKRYRASCNHCKMSKTRISRNLGVKPLLHFLGLHGHNVYARVQVYDNFGYGMVASYYQLDFVANTNKLFFTSSRWPYSIEQLLVIDDMAAALSPLHATSNVKSYKTSQNGEFMIAYVDDEGIIKVDVWRAYLPMVPAW